MTHDALSHTRAYVVEQYLPGAAVREAEASVAAVQAAPPTVDGLSARLACIISGLTKALGRIWTNTRRFFPEFHPRNYPARISTRPI